MKIYVEHSKRGGIKAIDIPAENVPGEFSPDGEENSITVVDLPELSMETPDHAMDAMAKEIIENFEVDTASHKLRAGKKPRGSTKRK